MRKLLTHLFAGAVVAKTIMGANPVGKVINTAVIAKDMGSVIVKGSWEAWWSRFSSRWQKVETNLKSKAGGNSEKSGDEKSDSDQR